MDKLQKCKKRRNRYIRICVLTIKDNSLIVDYLTPSPFDQEIVPISEKLNNTIEKENNVNA